MDFEDFLLAGEGQKEAFVVGVGTGSSRQHPGLAWIDSSCAGTGTPVYTQVATSGAGTALECCGVAS